MWIFDAVIDFVLGQPKSIEFHNLLASTNHGACGTRYTVHEYGGVLSLACIVDISYALDEDE